MRPIVAIVGRANVGKSTLFNRMTRAERSIVFDEPGVTRDRIYADATLSGARQERSVVLIDTGGFEPKTSDPMMERVREQTQLAIDEADVVVLLTDGRAGLVAGDQAIASFLRQNQKKVIVAVNKIDGTEHEPLAAEFHRLGMAYVLPISAAHNRHVRDLEECILDALTTLGVSEDVHAKDVGLNDENAVSASHGDPAATSDEDDADDAAEKDESSVRGPIRIAVIGRPNVGKSSLINRVLGEDRHLVSDIAGTTRDAVDSVVTRKGRDFVFIDTAGIRKKSSIALRLEKYSVVAALKGLDRSDVALLVIDPTQGIAEQDAKVAAFSFEKGRALILVVSKWDKKPADTNVTAYRDQVRRELPHLSYAPVLFVSAHTGLGLDKIFQTIERVHAEHGRRVSTGQLNRFLLELAKRHPPPTRKGRRAKIYYLRQIGTRPPRFLASVNDPSLVHFSYRRFLVNEIRERYGFGGVPVLVGYRRRESHK